MKRGQTEIIDTTSQRLSRWRPTNRSSPPNTTISMPGLPSHPPNVGFLWISDHGGDLAAGRSWAGEVAESKGPRLRLWRISPASFTGLQRRIRRQAGRLCVFTNWRWWKNMQQEFRCQMPLLEVHLKCLGIDRPHCRHPWGSFPAEAALDLPEGKIPRHSTVSHHCSQPVHLGNCLDLSEPQFSYS